MANNRIGRINEEIQRELSALLRTVKDPRLQGGLLTVTHVDTTSDLRYAKIYVSALDKSREKEMLKGLKSASGYLRRDCSCGIPRSCSSWQTTRLPRAPTSWRCCGIPTW